MTYNIAPSNPDLLEAIRATYAQATSIVVKNPTGYICARIGWTINLVFHEGDTLAVRERAWQVFDQLMAAINPTEMAWWYSGNPMAFTSKIAQNQLSKLREKSTENPHGYAMILKMASGQPKPPDAWVNNAQDFYFKTRIGNNEGIWLHDRHVTPGIGPAMSYIRIGLPVSWMENQAAAKNVGWLTNKLVELMQPFWCTAGWGVIPAVEERQISSSGGQQALHPYLKRFPGIDALGGLAMMDHFFNNAMHSVNWLSFVSDPLLEKLGGREAVRAKAQESPYLGVADVGNCLAVRAGAFPSFGDTQLEIPLPGYGAAARLLKPVRVASYWNNFVAPRGSGDETSQMLACDAYLSRFDYY